MSLYHYCSNEAFVSMASSRTIRLSELSLSNDFLEGVWIRRVFSKCCLERGVAQAEVDRLLGYMDMAGQILGAAAFCLSEEGDLLSQWRGYASDSAGVSIGLNKEYLEKLSENSPHEKFGFKLTQIEYEEEKQKELIRETVDRILEYVEEGALKRPIGLLASEEKKQKFKSVNNKLSYSFLHFLPYLFRLKNPAFIEEKEWRLTAIVPRNAGIGEPGMLVEMDYYGKKDRIVPYIEIGLVDLGVEPFDSVILGPKNLTPPEIMTGLLQRSGFKNVEVSKSEASFR